MKYVDVIFLCREWERRHEGFETRRHEGTKTQRHEDFLLISE